MSSLAPEIGASKRLITQRISQLDALRGLAALSVVLHHWWAISHFYAPPWVFRPLIAGHEAVILFFVLSGYVLSIPFWQGREVSYFDFLIRRFFRIYVPFLFALIFSSFGCWLFYGYNLPLTPFYYKTWQNHLTVNLFIGQLSMPNDPALNGAMWSLRFEVIISILFPFICRFIKKYGHFSWVFMGLALRGTQAVIVHSHFAAFPVVHVLASILYYSIFFVVGAGMAQEREIIARYLSQMRRFSLYAFCLMGIMAYYNAILLVTTAPTGDLISMLGAAALISVVQFPAFQASFDSALPQYFGRISYSLYLIHYTVLFSIFDIAYPAVPMTCIAIIYLGATIFLSDLFWRWVEGPAILVGKYSVRFFNRKKFKKQFAASETQ